jgi:hypothetical protein
VTFIICGDPWAGIRFDLFDPDGIAEVELELSVAQVLTQVYPSYECIVFTGTFLFEGRQCRPDLALVAKDRSHWLVVEVELLSHSFERHVLPQVRAFRYGDPAADCVSCLAAAKLMSAAQAETFLRFVPRRVAVIANKRNREWEIALASHGVQMLAVSVFVGPNDIRAIHIEGNLVGGDAHLGFGKVHLTDRAVCFGCDINVPFGEVQIRDANGAVGTWVITKQGGSTWFVKRHGVPDLVDGSYVQLVRECEGGLLFRLTQRGVAVRG